MSGGMGPACQVLTSETRMSGGVGWNPHVRFLRVRPACQVGAGVGPACQVGQGQVLASGTRMRWGWVGPACQVLASGTRMLGGAENNIKY